MSLAPIRDVLDRAGDGGRPVALWWRDDDATEHTPALDRLLGLARVHAAPLAVAAVPGAVGPSLLDRLRAERAVTVLVHGFRHVNHELTGRKQAEFGSGRSTAAARADAKAGRDLVRDAFGTQALAVFVPPWNRIAPAAAATLAADCFVGLSTFGGPARMEEGLRVVDTHLDPVHWRGSRGLVEPAALAAALSRAIAAGGPVGLLTHHLVFDRALWRFCEELLRLCADHPAVRFIAPRELWARETPSPNCAGMRVLSTAETDA